MCQRFKRTFKTETLRQLYTIRNAFRRDNNAANSHHIMVVFFRMSSDFRRVFSGELRAAYVYNKNNNNNMYIMYLPHAVVVSFGFRFSFQFFFLWFSVLPFPTATAARI